MFVRYVNFKASLKAGFFSYILYSLSYVQYLLILYMLVCFFTYTEKVKTRPAESVINVDSNSCDSVEIILPMDMDNIGIGCYELGIINIIMF